MSDTASLRVSVIWNSPRGTAIKALAKELICSLRDPAALVVGSLELVRGRQARAIAAGDRGGTVG